MLELYGSSSPNVLKVLIMLEELQLEYRTLHVSVLRGEQFAPDFLALNPLGRVPVLIDETLPEPLFESGAILIHLAEINGNAFLSADASERASVLKWLMFQMSSVGPMLGQRNHFIIMPQERDGYADRRYRDQADRIYRMLDRRLATVPWLAGAAYSIADMATYPWALYAEKHGVDPSETPHLAAWTGRVRDRPAVQRAEEAAGVFNTADAAVAPHVTGEDFDRLFWRATAGPAADMSQLIG